MHRSRCLVFLPLLLPTITGCRPQEANQKPPNSGDPLVDRVSYIKRDKVSQALEAHHVAKKGEHLVWKVPRLDHDAYIVTFLEKNVCTGDSLNGDGQTYLACPGKPAVCTLQPISEDKFYGISPATPDQKKLCTDSRVAALERRVVKSVSAQVNPSLIHSCNGCVVSPP